ncbi:MAG: urea ABC transporter ATP-binding protein UrtD [Devosia sp.]|jgi:urea transport system ATP-binding protein
MIDETAPPAPTVSTRPAARTMLYLNGVSVAFDGFKALNNLSIIVHPAEMLAIIGPNGAGKTTMMDIITGKTRADSGDVLFDDTVDLRRLDEAKIANLGIGRKFQKPTVFESQTVWDNLLLALKKPRGVFPTLVDRVTRDDSARIEEILATIRLSSRKGDLAAGLSHGQKQWLEIGMLLAQDPKLLLVDEPVAGMTDAETVETAKLLRDIARTRSVLVVEHDMSFVRELGCRVTCLAEGSVLAEGTLEQVSQNPVVIERYLGR